MYLLNKYIKYNIWRLAVRYGIYINIYVIRGLKVKCRSTEDRSNFLWLLYNCVSLDYDKLLIPERHLVRLFSFLTSFNISSSNSDLIAINNEKLHLGVWNSLTTQACLSNLMLHKISPSFLVNKTNRCTEFQFYWYCDSICFG